MRRKNEKSKKKKGTVLFYKEKRGKEKRGRRKKGTVLFFISSARAVLLLAFLFALVH